MKICRETALAPPLFREDVTDRPAAQPLKELSRSRLFRHGQLRLPEVEHLDASLDSIDQRFRLGLLKPPQDAVPSVGKAAGLIILAVLEKGVESPASFAVVALYLQEPFTKRAQVGLGKCERVRNNPLPAIDRPRVKFGETGERPHIIPESARVIPDKDF